jgi:hypothetical protein
VSGDDGTSSRGLRGTTMMLLNPGRRKMDARRNKFWPQASGLEVVLVNVRNLDGRSSHGSPS